LRKGTLFRKAVRVRIDASVSFPPGWTTAQLQRILLRNRFEGVIAHGEPFEDAPEWILGWIGPPGAPDHPRLAAIVSGLEDAAETVRRNLAAEIAEHDLTAIAEFATTHPDARIVVPRTAGAGFGPTPDKKWLAGLAALARTPNVFLKIDGFLSAPPPHGPWIQAALEHFGPQRCIYGSGWPLYTTPGTWKEALACFTQSIGARSIEFREHVLGGTAWEAYGVSTLTSRK